MKPSDPGVTQSYIDTPEGIFTENGIWFHTTRKELKKYAGDLFNHESLDSLLQRATAWIQLPRSFTIILSALIYSFIDLPTSIILLILVYFLSSISGPLYVSHVLYPIARVLSSTIVQATIYTVFLSYTAMNGDYTTSLVGLLTFIGIRWGIVDRLFNLVIEWCRTKIYAVPYEDQVLNSVIVRASMKYRTHLTKLAEMEESILRKMNRHA